MPFEISNELIDRVRNFIHLKNDASLLSLFSDEHHADIAEILNELHLNEATYIVKLLDSDKTSDILMEVDEDVREQILKNLSSKEIAEELEELDTDDAADIIAELPEHRKAKVMSQIVDEEHVKDIAELLKYDEDSAGGLMAKELVKVNENWNVLKCVREMRAQANEVTRVHSIYVVDNDNKLKGRLSLKDLLVTPTKTHISEVYIPKVDSVNVNDEAEDVARIMQKYDLEAIPVVDDDDHLLGRITIDDIVDLIKEEAEKDYQMAAGISEDVEADDSIWQLTRARLPWLILALMGSFVSVYILTGFGSIMNNPEVRSLFFFTPLIAAMAGNVGVQSSAIIVQGLANDNIKGSLWKRLLKEVGLTLFNGLLLSAIILIFGTIMAYDITFSLTISISLIAVIIIASLIGTFVPILLNNHGIDPALATGPFITTSNDIFGILAFFYIAKMILGF
jgi:magnesium transporter